MSSAPEVARWLGDIRRFFPVSVVGLMIVFDTAVVDLTADLHDSVDLFFGARLGGGPDIHKALTYCEGLVRRPSDTVLVLVSDLYEGGDAVQMLKTGGQNVRPPQRVPRLAGHKKPAGYSPRRF